MKLVLWFTGCLLCATLFVGCGPSTFLIEKDGSSAYFGSDRPFLRSMLCSRGDLKTILAHADLPADVRGDFLRYVCSDNRSFESTTSLYLFLSPEEKSRLKKAFEQQGYRGNYINC